MVVVVAGMMRNAEREESCREKENGSKRSEPDLSESEGARCFRRGVPFRDLLANPSSDVQPALHRVRESAVRESARLAAGT
jgi:hypothetical protein